MKSLIYHKNVLANDLRIVTHPMKERDSVAIGLCIRAGGRDEGPRIKGAAHFLEHMLFKGSEKYSCTEIKELVEGVGGTLNAFTTEEVTCYYAKIPSRHLATTFDVLADIVFFPKLSAKDLERERTVILEEIKMYHDLPQYFVMELLDGLLWPGHPLGQNLAGTFESVSKMSGKDLQTFHRMYYRPGNVVVAAAGNIRRESLIPMVRKKLVKEEDGSAPGFLKADNPQSHPRAQFHRKAIEQMHVALGMVGLDYFHEDRYALNLLNIILGGNMSSRLFNEVREKRGLAYSISSGTKSLQDTGMFLVRAGVDSSKVVETIEVILKELNKIARREVSKTEFVRARDYFLGQVALALEDTMDHMLWVGESMLARNRIRTFQEVEERIKKVTPKDILRVGADVIRSQRFNLAVVGPLTDAQEQRLQSLMGV